jgi:TRAP-type C4-dicarboxylate transport system permease small subunit
MDDIRKVLNKVLNLLAGLSFVAMVLLTVWQVFTRYIMKDPSSWTEELVSYMFAWASLLGASVVTGERGHMNIPILVDKMGKNGRKFLLIFAELIALAFSAIILVYGGTRITSLAMGQLTTSLGSATVGLFYTVMPVCGILNILYCLLNIVDICREREVY